MQRVVLRAKIHRATVTDADNRVRDEVAVS
ncbi:MAG: aspartate 1-decarboxylase [Candidatus Dormibacteraeota bacterium]|nr:aspartate 1-decarboxylase [Candidatus Dormibacteraeota bacterium]